MKARVIAPLLLTLTLVVGCATTGNRMTVAADQLDSVANTFAARSDSSSPTAREFSDEAREFRATLADQPSKRDVLLAYERLWRRYHTLRHEVSSSDNSELQAQWRSVSAAFADVQQRVKTQYSDDDVALYGRGGYVFDPYYN